MLGVDPAYRTGCKLAVVDSTGKVAAHRRDIPNPAAEPRGGSGAIVRNLIRRFNVTTIAIGNGTASRETECS